MSVERVVFTAIKSWFSTRLAQARSGAHRWTVLCLHDVPHGKDFELLITDVSRRFKVLPFSDGFRAIRSGATEGPVLSLTFDDADKTVFSNCLPVLRDRGIPACLFVCTGFVDAGIREVSAGCFDVMTWPDLEAWVAAGLEIGAHTVNHVPLSQATLERSKWEILESKRVLEERLGIQVRHFAYPWGYYTDELDLWLQKQAAFETISTTIPRDNYPSDTGKHIYRKSTPRFDTLVRGLKNPSLYETVRAAHQRSIMNGLAPVLWRMEARPEILPRPRARGRVSE